MRARTLAGLTVLVAALIAVSSVFNIAARRTDAASHREAPLISQDPAADNTDLYAFVSPDKPDTVTIIAGFYPGQDPAGGPNFYRFGDDVIYDIHVDNNHDAVEDITYRFDFATETRDPNTFLYNTGPIESLDDENWNVRQFYSVSEIRGGTATQRAEGLLVPPANVGEQSTPNYRELFKAGRYDVGDGIRVFAGQTDDPFWVDLGGVFDLLQLRGENAVDDLAGLNVQTIAIQVPIAQLSASGAAPTGADDPNAVIGVWSTTSRFSTTVVNADGSRAASGDLVQVSRLGMPLVNEVVVPLGAKDLFNASHPSGDSQFLPGVLQPQLPSLLNAIYGIEVPQGDRNDLVAVFLTGLPGLNAVEGATPSEMLRLNMAIPPTPFEEINPLGVIGGDDAGFPNGRRLQDEVIDIELRVVAGILVGEEFNVAPNNALDDGVPANDVEFLTFFPYVAPPHAGTDLPPAGAADAGGDDGGDTAGDTAVVELAELNDSGVSGSAELVDNGDGTSTVTLTLDGATGGHPAHIHEGTCDNLAPNPLYPLTEVDAAGESVTADVPAVVADLMDGGYAINIHKGPAQDEIGIYVACGEIG